MDIACVLIIKSLFIKTTATSDSPGPQRTITII